MFTLAGAQPAIKLAAFKGLPIAKAVGIIWVISWMVVEVLALLARDVEFGSEEEGPLTLRQHAASVAARKFKEAEMLRKSLSSLASMYRDMNSIMCH